MLRSQASMCYRWEGVHEMSHMFESMFSVAKTVSIEVTECGWQVRVCVVSFVKLDQS